METRHVLEGVPAQLWRMVVLAQHRMLMLDYDGTLAPFRVDRSEARPLRRSVQALMRIASSGHTDVAIVSGRPVAEVERMLDGVPAIVVGEHGWERRDRGGEIVRRPLEPPVAAGLDAVEQLSRDAGWGDWIERKRTAVVLHTRGRDPDLAGQVQERCRAAWGRRALAGQLAIDRINGGLELRALGHNKGTVVLSLLSQSPPGTLGVFLGDDVTDEDAFEAVRDRGFGVRVGAPGGQTAAQGNLPSCEAVGDFLEHWIQILGPAAPMA